MGKRIIQQRRGRGTSTYRVKGKAFRYKLGYPRNISGKGEVKKIINSPAHTAPIAKIVLNDGRSFFIPANKGMYENQEIDFDSKEIENGKIMQLDAFPIKTQIYCIESVPGNGGQLIRAGGQYATVTKFIGNQCVVTLPSKKQKRFNKKSRAIVGVVAGHGRLEKPIVKAGKKYKIMKAKSKLWPRTGALKMNAVDHPFGSGRGKNPKSKIAKRNASPGKKVGLLRPKRTGKKK
ncbi:MAG TPA: 50S ribosomal protein L2 [Candidatus Nanoarchaeia archaeon]|nr:50S ribosomal protein L2 [Candidatus Nanoarchaeia archaeon]